MVKINERGKLKSRPMLLSYFEKKHKETKNDLDNS